MQNMFNQPAPTLDTVHVEFRAGICDYNGTQIKPDARKGKVSLLTSNDDGMMHFQWTDRTKNEVVTDLLVIEDLYLERIEKDNQGNKVNGRVYVARFTSNSKKLFFWMQEPDESKDEPNVKKFNTTIGATIPDKNSRPGTAAAGVPGAAAPAAPGAAPAAGAAGAPVIPGQAPVDPQLQAILNQFIASQQGGGAAQRAPVLLKDVLTADVLQTLLTDEAAVEELTGLLPEGQKTREDLEEVLVSPQLQQSMGPLTQAVHSDQLPILFATLSLNPQTISTVAPGTDALEILCKALEDKLGEGSAPGAGSSA